ncbi:MAG: PSD1 and planctomycete cytochrome C domain-containing protein [Bacteroidota bacterium]|nr:PSD1 and planctomycete cytochrome C domain-containing protein [Bacteroidota bacterium]
MQRALILAFAVAAGVTICTGCSPAPEVSFNEDIRPILNERCGGCHGGIRRQGNLSLLFRSEAIAAAESGHPAIVPYKPAESELLRRVTHADPDERMPQEDAPLSPDEVTKLRQWIREGAPWEDHWAYVRPVRPELPEVSNPDWPQRDLDYFVLARLDAEQLLPAPGADCAVLVRRVTLDLTGLAPRPDAIAQVCAEDSAYGAYVDTLLASPAFGEHWAAMWLDLARYADSKGYEKDIGRTIWRYRDWVIRAFNADMPFDQFTIEQMAGDLLPSPTEDQLIATAFHRNSMTNTEGGTDDEEFRVAAVVDRVNTTWEVWQGTSFACVQCHGHPYDPFVHEDYYKSFAFFNSTADRDQDDEYPTLPLFAEEDLEQGQGLVQQLRDIEVAILALMTEDLLVRERQDWETRLNEPEVIARVRGMLQAEVRRVAATVEHQRDDAQRWLLDYVYAGLTEDTRLIALREERARLRKAIADLSQVETPIMQELPFSRRTHVFERGNFLLKGDAVAADVPASLPAMPEDAPKNRLGLARWLISPENPLTARVTVNRFWAQLFGQGIVESLEDFGTQGYLPSHPDLLDFLAVSFMEEHNWSIKRLLRTLVHSATYQQSSGVTPELLKRDPRNVLLARGARFRLSAEQIRDQTLYVSGLLSPKMYGPSVMPPQPAGLWNNPYDPALWVPSEGEDRYRRGLYTYWRRTVPYPSMATFDSPSREFCVSRRMRTNTPLQALVSLNDPTSVEAAAALARRVGDSEVPVEAAYTLAMGTTPNAEVRRILQNLYADALSHYAGPGAAQLVSPEHAALTVVSNAIMNLDTFIMKE